MPRKKRPTGLKSLPQDPQEIWEIGRRPMEVEVAELTAQGEQAELALIVTATEPPGVVLADLCTTSASPALLADLVRKAMRHPMFGPPRRPASVRVDTQDEAQALRTTLSRAGVSLEVTPELPMLDAFHAEAMEMFGGIRSDYRSAADRAGTPLSPEGLHTFFDTARTFYRRELWDAFDDSDIFTVSWADAENVSHTVYGIVMGSMGQEFGLALYHSLDDIQRLFDLHTPDMDAMLAHFAGTPELSDAAIEEHTAELLAIPALGLTFTPRRDVPQPLLDEAKHLGLRVAKAAAFPLLFHTTRAGMRLAGTAELQVMLIALRAILAWEKAIETLDVDDDYDVTITSELPAVPDFLPTLTVNTTLIPNPAVSMDEDEDEEDEDDDDFEDMMHHLGRLFDMSDAKSAPRPAGKQPSKQSPSVNTPRGLSPASPQLYTLRVYLQGGPIAPRHAGKEISREIQIRGSDTLHTLHAAIFEAFERWEEHLYEFNLGESPQDQSQLYFYQGGWADEELSSGGDPVTTTLDELDLQVGRYFGYTFDMGDQWEHVIEVVAVKKDTGKGTYPRVSKKVGAAPPQYPDEDDLE
jgi:hypothetical protein